MAVTMIIQSGKRRGTKLVLSKPEIIIGRDEGCGLRLAARDVSRQHCRLLVEGNVCRVEDLGSQNGTLVNNEPISGLVVLKPGDRIVIGPLELLVGPAEPKPASKPHGPKSTSSTSHSTKVTASDDDVASWLMEPGDKASTGDESTVTMQAYRGSDPEPPSAGSEMAAESPTQSPRHFTSLAEEAQDIIRRHLEKLAQSE